MGTRTVHSNTVSWFGKDHNSPSLCAAACCANEKLTPQMVLQPIDGVLRDRRTSHRVEVQSKTGARGPQVLVVL